MKTQINDGVRQKSVSFLMSNVFIGDRLQNRKGEDEHVLK